MPPFFIRPVRSRAFLPAFLLLACLGIFREARADDKIAPVVTSPRQILICTSSQASPALQKSIADFAAQAGKVPLLKALIDGQEATGFESQTSDELMDKKAYDRAAHNHLVVVGLLSQDPVLAKTSGFDATIDETKKTVYSEGWGYLQGDIGWVESDRNPFLHSRRIKSAPEDTILVRITGTSEAGVVAALQAFEGGMLNGFVVAGPLGRPKTTLLDLDPLATPGPGTLPTQVKIGDGMAALIGWNQIPEQEYRAVLESTGVEPKKMWRYKYLVPGIMEKEPIIRWLGGVNHMAFGNAIDVIECASTDDATAAAEKLSAMSNKDPNFKDRDSSFKSISLAGSGPAWEAPQIADEVMRNDWNIIVTSSGPYLFLSTLPEDGTSAVIAAVSGANTH
jgi:hypothetical protein